MTKKQIPHWPNILFTNEVPSFGVDFFRPLLKTIKDRVDDFDITLFDGLKDLDALYDRIIEYIKEYVDLKDDEKEKYPIENIFHMIQVWGGKTGRNIYVMVNDKKVVVENAFKYNWDKDKYLMIVNKCLNIHYDKGFNDQELKELVDVIKDNHISQLGTAFITKHVRFWTSINLGNNALPIFDSVINNNLYGNKRQPQVNELLAYWEHMIAKAEEKGIGLVPLERQLFLYIPENTIAAKSLESDKKAYYRPDFLKTNKQTQKHETNIDVLLKDNSKSNKNDSSKKDERILFVSSAGNGNKRLGVCEWKNNPTESDKVIIKIPTCKEIELKNMSYKKYGTLTHCEINKWINSNDYKPKKKLLFRFIDQDGVHKYEFLKEL